MAYFCQESSMSAFRNISYTFGLPHRELFRVRDRDAMTAVSRLRCVSPPRPESGVITGHGPRRRLSPSRLEDQSRHCGSCLQRRTSVTPDRVPASGSEKVRGHVFFLSKGFWFFGFFVLPPPGGKWVQGLAGRGLTCRAMAQTKPLNSRATAVTATWDFFLPTRVRCW